MKTVYIIGEIGQNHNGSVDIAKLLVDLVVRPIKEDLTGLELKAMDAIKLVKRDLDQEMTDSQKNRVYDGPNSFGKTYGEHRAFLELSFEDHYEVYKHAKKKGLDVIETLCAISTLDILKYFTPDKLKVASRDLTNLPLLNSLAETKLPIILSTGMGGKYELDTAIDIITKHHTNVSILHCVSEYPTKPNNANLLTIKYLRNNYPDFIIGYSDHTIGISAPVAAVTLGAEIIEKHITIDRRMRGSDQAGSLGPDGVQRLIRDIRITEMSLGVEDLFIEPSVKEAMHKLERSIAAKRNIEAGDYIKMSDIQLLSPGIGVKWIDKDKIIGKRAKCYISKNELILLKDVE